jgi:hypothetical protein
VSDDSLAVGADIGLPDVVTKDHQDVWFFCLRVGWSGKREETAQQERHENSTDPKMRHCVSPRRFLWSGMAEDLPPKSGRA